MSSKMYGILKSGPKPGFDYSESIDTPQIKNSTDVKLKMIFNGICGTDLHIYKWDEWAQNTITTPQVNGHEGLGKVVEIGSDVMSCKVGDFVSFETHIYDGTCRICKMDGKHVCANMTILGLDTPGVWGEYSVVPENVIFKLDGSVPLELCGMLEPYGNAHHTVTAGPDVKGKNVLVMGDGPIGIFAALIAEGLGAKSLAISGITPSRQKIAEDCGLTFINPMKQSIEKEMDKITNGEGVDLIIEMSGAPTALSEAVKIINTLGTINVLSIYPMENVSVKLNVLVFKNVSVNFITGRKIWDTWNDGYKLLKDKKIDWEKFMKVNTHKIAFKDFQKGIDLLIEGKASKVILIHPSAEKELAKQNNQ